MSRAPLLILVGAVVVAGVYLVNQTLPRAGGWPAYDAAEKRLATVHAASAATVPGAKLLTVSHPSSFTGERGASGPLVTYLTVLRRRHDVAGQVPDDARGGPVRTLLELARVQAEMLARGGFDAVRAEWSVTGHEDRMALPDGEDPEHFMAPNAPLFPSWDPRDGPHRPKIHVVDRHQSGSGSGGGRTQVNLNAPSILHYRIYLVPKSGASLFVRNRFDQATGVIASEWQYSDRTLHGVEYPTGSTVVGRAPGRYQLEESIVDRD